MRQHQTSLGVVHDVEIAVAMDVLTKDSITPVGGNARKPLDGFLAIGVEWFLRLGGACRFWALDIQIHHNWILPASDDDSLTPEEH